MILRRHTDAERGVGDEEHRLAAKEEAGEAHRCVITRTDAAVCVDEFRRRALETARAFFPGRFATEHAYVQDGRDPWFEQVGDEEGVKAALRAVVPRLSVKRPRTNCALSLLIADVA